MSDLTALQARAEQRLATNRLGKSMARETDLDLAVIRDLLAVTRRLNRLEYAIARPASMPDMSGQERWTLIVSTTFPSFESAENARRRVPALRGNPATIVARIAPGSDWEEVGDE